MTARRFKSMAAVRGANARTGQSWFSTGATRYFGSRVLPTLYGGRYFVTSEQCPPNLSRRPIVHHPRLYSVREALVDGTIDTIGEFQGYETPEAAITAAKKLAAQEG